MNAILDYLRGLIGREKSIDTIVSPMKKIVRDLETYSSKQAARATEKEAKVNTLRQEAKAGRDEAASASRLAGNYKNLVSPVAE